MNDLPRYLLVALLIAALILIHELGHFLAAKALRIPVREFALGMGPRVWGFRWGETECRLNALPLGGYCAFWDDVKEEADAEAPPARDMLRNRPVWQRFLVLSGGVAFNYAFAFLLLVGTALTIGFAEVKTGDVAVTQVMAGQPAATAGFREGDHVLAVDGAAVKTPDDFIALTRAHAGRPMTVSLRRGATHEAITLVPNAQGKIGVGIQAEFLSRDFKRPAQPLVAAAQTQWTMTAQNVEGFARLVTGRLNVNELGGVVEIGRAGAYVAKHDARDLLTFTALISIGLAVMNVLPLPALDGGQLVFLLIEAIRRRPIPRNIEAPIQVGGLYVLLGLMTLLLIKDIVRPIKYPELPSPTPAVSPAPSTSQP